MGNQAAKQQAKQQQDLKNGLTGPMCGGGGNEMPQQFNYPYFNMPPQAPTSFYYPNMVPSVPPPQHLQQQQQMKNQCQSVAFDQWQFNRGNDMKKRIQTPRPFESYPLDNSPFQIKYSQAIQAPPPLPQHHHHQQQQQQQQHHYIPQYHPNQRNLSSTANSSKSSSSFSSVS
jgi:hypothetical protein